MKHIFGPNNLNTQHISPQIFCLTRWGQSPEKSFSGANPKRGTKCCPTIPDSSKTTWSLSDFFKMILVNQGRGELFLFLFLTSGTCDQFKRIETIWFQANHHASPAFIPASERLNYRYFQFVILLLTDYKHYCTISKKPGAFGFSDQVASWQSFTTLQKPSLNSATTLPRSLTDI